MRLTLLVAAAAATATLAGAPGADARCHSHRCYHRVSVKRHLEFPQHHPERYHWRTAIASWYGPGFYGHGMACGGPLTTSTVGVAHKSLPCGTRLTVCASRCVAMTVVDRGPYVAGREFDLTGAAKLQTGFGSVGPVRYRIMR